MSFLELINFLLTKIIPELTGTISHRCSMVKTLISPVLFSTSLFPHAARSENLLKKASFIPQWSPQAQFAGFYIAYEKGFYKKNGIDFTIIQGGPDPPSTDFLEKGKADFYPPHCFHIANDVVGYPHPFPHQRHISYKDGLS